MNDKSIIFGHKIKPVRPSIPKNNQPTKQRKKRSDAKKDIKFKLSHEDKRKLQMKAMEHNMSLTAFASMVVKHYLSKNKEYDHFKYDNNGEFVHVVLEKEYFETVKMLKVEWGLSYRKVAHRIIKQYLQSISGLSIYHYKDRRINK